MINPKLMCRQHLGGEHNELHMLAGSLRRIATGQAKERHTNNLIGLARGNCLQIADIVKRHDIIVKEWEARGYFHFSPLTADDCPLVGLPPDLLKTKVDNKASYALLLNRCPYCREIHSS